MLCKEIRDDQLIVYIGRISEQTNITASPIYIYKSRKIKVKGERERYGLFKFCLYFLFGEINAFDSEIF